MNFLITIRATSVLVYPGDEAVPILRPLLQAFHFEDEFEEVEHVIGYVHDPSTNILYLNKGVDINYVKRLLSNVKVVFDEYTPFAQMKFKWEEIVPPRDDEQVDVIDFITGYGSNDTSEFSQLFVTASTGFGKTMCSGYACGQLGMKTLIITHRDSIRNQWRSSLMDMNGFPSKRIYELVDSTEIEKVIRGEVVLDYDIYLMTHATFRSCLKRVNSIQEMGKLASILKIGLKIIDEAHLEFKSTILIDVSFNVKRNLYLTATAGRSQKDENIIFKHVFTNAEYYKKAEGLVKKWVEYNLVHVDTNVPPNIYRYRLCSGRGMSPATYGKWVIKRDKKQTHFKVCLEIVKQTFREYDKSKIIIFLPLIELCTELQFYLNTNLSMDDDFDYELMLTTINSKNSKSDNERNKKGDCIITTIASSGTGTDISGITTIINCSPFNSGITANQVFGRIRYNGRICQFYDVVDQSVKMDSIWWNNRYKAIKHRVLKFASLTWECD